MFSKLFDYPGPLWRVWSLVASLLIVLDVIVMGSVVIVSGLCRAPRWWQTRCIHFFHRWIYFVSRTRREVVGLENHDPNKPSLIVCNHQSYWDIPTTLVTLGGHIRMVTKKELAYVPFFGWALAASEFIFIDRGNKKSGRVASEKIYKKIRSGIHVWVAPEGTRSRTWEMGDFKKGSFAMAIEASVPVQPVVMMNTTDVLAKAKWLFKPGMTVRVRVLPRVSTTGLRVDQRGELSERVRGEMDRALREDRQAHARA